MAVSGIKKEKQEWLSDLLLFLITIAMPNVGLCLMNADASFFAADGIPPLHFGEKLEKTASEINRHGLYRGGSI